ncbi:hypothetical protein [Actinoplanes sp. DH11]|uniref:hypothetical protein n=1 Tax=Actinoplanes sp. DH11 TaxID=2857011 RepID=UPI001E2C8854|nr:hypothetical protein [Actinoplanes sp. DH11]
MDRERVRANGEPTRDSVITIRRSGSGYGDVLLMYVSLDDTMPAAHEDGWLWLLGYIVGAPISERFGQSLELFYARPVDGEPHVFTMLPSSPLPEPGPELGKRNAAVLAGRLAAKAGR